MPTKAMRPARTPRVILIARDIRRFRHRPRGAGKALRVRLSTQRASPKWRRALSRAHPIRGWSSAGFPPASDAGGKPALLLAGERRGLSCAPRRQGEARIHSSLTRTFIVGSAFLHVARPRNRPPPHLRDHFAPRRRQDHAHGEIPPLRQRHPPRRRRHRRAKTSAPQRPTGWNSRNSAASPISSTVLQFDYAGCAVNLLDTPGHKDFSEDTYRVLTAVDAALMVSDAAKGVETQTRKLFEVCRRRGVPILHVHEQVRSADAQPDRSPRRTRKPSSASSRLPSSGPSATARSFRGVFDRRTRDVHLFERVPGGKFQAPRQRHRPRRSRWFVRETRTTTPTATSEGPTRDARRCRPPLRPRRRPSRQTDPRLLRQRREQFRHPAPARRVSQGLRPARAAPRGRNRESKSQNRKYGRRGRIPHHRGR